MLGGPSVVTLVVMVLREDELARSARARVACAGLAGRRCRALAGKSTAGAPVRAPDARPEWCVLSTRFALDGAPGYRPWPPDRPPSWPACPAWYAASASAESTSPSVGQVGATSS